MRDTFLIVFIVSLWTINAEAAPVELFGYYEWQFMGASPKNTTLLLNTNKLRVDLQRKIGSNVEIGANFDYLNYSGTTTINALDFLPDWITNDIPDTSRISYEYTYRDRSFLDNAYVRMRFHSVDVTMGRQQISLGTGYAFNPTDVFNFKDLMDPTYEQPGHNALRLDVPLGHAFSLVALYAPEAVWENSGKLLRLKGRWGHFDFSIIGTETQWILTHYPEPGSYVAFLKRRLVGGDFAGELLGLGVWAEGAYNFVKESKDFRELLVGGDYTFDSELYLMLEFYHHSLAKSDYRKYDLNDWLRFFYQEQKSLTRDQVYCLIQYPVTDLLKIGGSTLISLSDGSIALVPNVLYSFHENVEFTFIGNINVGKEGKAYGSNQGHSLFLRSRVYF